MCFSGWWVFRCPLPEHVQTDCEWRNRATWSDETSGENLLCFQCVAMYVDNMDSNSKLSCSLTLSTLSFTVANSEGMPSCF